MFRRIVLLVPTALLALLVSGCGPSQSEIEKSIRDEMQSGLGVTITNIDLKKQSDGGYTGTATAQNGDDYDVTVAPPKGNKAEWKAIPGPKFAERLVRKDLEQRLSSKVVSCQLTKKEPGHYNGVAEMENGSKWNVGTHMEGMSVVVDVPQPGQK